MLSLDVAVCTFGTEGLSRVEKMLPPPSEGVRYVVSWQQHEDAKIQDSLLNRDDVEIYRLDVKGLSNNRNNAIDHCKADIILISDDDLEYLPHFSDIIRETFEREKELDLAVFKVDFFNKKQYPHADTILKLPFPKDYFVSSIEIVFRREKIHDLRFYPEMGLGAELMHCGEEELFVVSAIKRQLQCKFINKTISRHDSDTTGDKVSDGILRGQGFMIGVIYPFTSVLRIPLKAYRVSKYKGANFFRSLLQLTKGAFWSKTRWSLIPIKFRW